MNPKKAQNDLQKMLAFGDEVTIEPEASSISGKKAYQVNLSDAAISEKLDFASMAMYFKQHIDAQTYYAVNGHARPKTDDIAPLGYQEIFLELLDMAQALEVVGGTIIYVEPPAAPPNPPILITSIENAAGPMGLTVPTEFVYQVFVPGTPGEPGVPETLDHYDDVSRPVLPLDKFLILYILTEQGPKGDPGDPGVGQTGPVGPVGPAGANGECLDCQPGGQPDGGGGGPPGSDGGGSGPGGTPNPDGGDVIVFIPGCSDPILNFPYCSDAFSFANADLRAAIVAAVNGTGQFNSSTDELISVVLEWTGAAYGGVASVSVPTPTEYLPPQSNTAKFLVVTDAPGTSLVVPHSIESFGIQGVLVVQGYNYSGTTGLKMKPVANPISLNGQMSNYPLIGNANCHNPPDATDPAWLKVCLRSFVKHTIVGCPDLDIEPSYHSVPFLAHFSSGVWTDDTGKTWRTDGLDCSGFNPAFVAWRCPSGGSYIHDIYGFKAGHTYKMRLKNNQYHGGTWRWGIMYNDLHDLIIYSSTVDIPGLFADNQDLHTIELGELVIPADFELCSLFAVKLERPSNDDFNNDFEIYEA